MSRDYIFEPRPVFSSYTPNLFLGSYYIEDDFQADPSMWADPLEDAFVTNAGMKEGKIDTVTYLNDFSAETLLMKTKKLDELDVLPQSYFWKWDHYDAQLQIPTEISEDDFESPAYEEFLEAAVGYDSDNPYFLLVVDSFMDEGEDIDIWPEEADWSRIQTTVRWWKLYDLWMEAEGVDFLTNLAHEDYDWSIRNAGELQNIGYEIPEPDDDDYYWSMRQAETFAAGNEGHWMTFGRVDYNWTSIPEEVELTDEEFQEIDELIRDEIRHEIDRDNIPGEGDITWATDREDGIHEAFTISYYWGPVQNTGVNSAEGFEAEMGDLVKDNEWIVFGTKKTGGTTQGNQGMMLGRSPSLKGAKKMMENFRKKGYGNRYATIGKRLKRQKALLGGLLEAETLVWKDKTLSFMDWAKQEEASHLKKYRAESFAVESEYENHIQEAFFEDELEDGTPQWTFLYRCNDCGSLCVANDTGRMDESEFCSDGGEDHDMEIIAADPLRVNEDEEDYDVVLDEGEPWYTYECDCGTKNYSSGSALQSSIYFSAVHLCDECESDIDPSVGWHRMSEAEMDEMVDGLEADSKPWAKCDCGTEYSESEMEELDAYFEEREMGTECFNCGGHAANFTGRINDLDAESFEAPYTGAGSLMGITGDTDLSSFTPDELTKSSAIHGDFDTASLDYSGHQNIEVRADTEEDHLECSRCGDSSPVYFGILSLCKSCQKLVDSYPAYLRAELKRVTQAFDSLIYDLQTCDECGGHREELDCSSVCSCSEFYDEDEPKITQQYRSESVPVTTWMEKCVGCGDLTVESGESGYECDICETQPFGWDCGCLKEKDLRGWGLDVFAVCKNCRIKDWINYEELSDMELANKYKAMMGWELEAEEGDNEDWDDSDYYDPQDAWESIFETWMEEWVTGGATRTDILRIYAAKNGIVGSQVYEVDVADAAAWYEGLTIAEREDEIFTTTGEDPSVHGSALGSALDNIIADQMDSWDDQFMSESFAANDPPSYRGLLLKPADHSGRSKICDAKGCRKVMKHWRRSWGIPYYFCDHHQAEIDDTY